MIPSSVLGWRRSRPGVDQPGHHLISKYRKVVAPLAHPSLFDFRSARIDQGQASSCVAFALTRSLQLFYTANGLIAPLASPRQLYYDGRREEWAGQDPTTVPPLEDTGTEPRLMMQVTKALGFVSWDACPYSDAPESINTQPAPELYEEAFDCRGLDDARIIVVGQQAVQQAADALKLRMPVLFGMDVDEAFMSNTGSRITGIDGHRLVGGHMLAVLAVLDAQLLGDLASLLPASAQVGDVLFDNWWGTGDSWGNELGLGLMSGGLFGSSWVSDRTILRAAPGLEAA